MKGHAAKGHTKKHAKKATAKHHSAKAKHKPFHNLYAATHQKAKVHAKAKHPHHAKAVGLALAPSDVACCGAEALAASLRLGGLSVPDAEMLDLFWRAGGHPDKGMPIGEMLEAAAEHGLAGMRLVSFEPVDLADPWRLLDEGLPGIILGLDLPGSHTVWDDGRSWWSWGKPYPVTAFPDAVIEEVWAVSWEVVA